MSFVFSIRQALRHSKKGVNIYQSTRRNIPEDLNLSNMSVTTSNPVQANLCCRGSCKKCRGYDCVKRNASFYFERSSVKWHTHSRRPYTHSGIYFFTLHVL